MVTNNTIQGLIIIDKQEMTEEEYSEFQQFTRSFFINFKRLNTIDNKELYSCLALNKELLFDSEDYEGNVIKGAISHLSHRNPLLIGLWNSKGVPLGKEYVQLVENAIDDEGNISTIGQEELQGEAEYPFLDVEYIKFMPDIPDTKDLEGNILTWKRPTEAKQLHKYGGYGDLILE